MLSIFTLFFDGGLGVGKTKKSVSNVINVNVICRVTLPFTNSEVFVEKMTSYIAIKAVLGLVAMWNEDDSFMVRISYLIMQQTNTASNT